MLANKTKVKLAAREVVLGAFIRYHDPERGARYIATDRDGFLRPRDYRDGARP